MVKHRLVFGTLMTIAFVGIAVLDAYFDGSLTTAPDDNPPWRVQATILAVLVGLLLIPANFELARLTAAKGLSIFTTVSIPASIVLATSWYWRQCIDIPVGISMPIVMAIALPAVFLVQYLRHGTEGAIGNCGVNCLSIIYLGVLSSFVLAIRLDFGVWHLLMAVFAVKCADIGAYTIGTLWGRHKFSPKISPGKTWEGMAGAVGAGMAVSVAFAGVFGIMVWWLGAVFGVCFAVIGQAGDLLESMMKRDARQKDSASKVPGFGGVLDITDSPLAAVPFAYLFFSLVA